MVHRCCLPGARARIGGCGRGWRDVCGQDMGGPWRESRDDGRPHGLDIVHALAGPGNWGTETTSDGDRIVWARLHLPTERLADA